MNYQILFIWNVKTNYGFFNRKPSLQSLNWKLETIYHFSRSKIFYLWLVVDYKEKKSKHRGDVVKVLQRCGLWGPGNGNPPMMTVYLMLLMFASATVPA